MNTPNLPEQSEITRMSLYRFLPGISAEANAHLVQNVESGKTYVKKELRNYDRSVFEYIKMRSIPGIPHIVDIIENFAEEDRPDILIIIEEYITGSTLREVLDAYGSLKPDIAFDYMTQLCQILQPLHDRKRPIVHLRITPENVMITGSGQVYLLNFDSAREIDPDELHSFSKPAETDSNSNPYIVSGQYENLPAEPQTDILECGALFREMISGVSPASPAPKVPVMNRSEIEILEPIISKCTETEPSARYTDASALLTALTEAAPEIGELLYERDPASRKNKIMMRLMILLFILSVIFLTFFIWKNLPIPS